MKKSSLIVAAFALATIAGGFASAQAATCGPNNTDPVGRTKADPFGSCETTSGSVKCGAGQDVGGVFTLIVLNTANKGVQGCSGPADLLPIGGRVSVLVDGNNNVAIGIDGSDSENSGGASAWQRYDVRPGEGAVCARRASGGTWWTGASGGKGASTVGSESGNVNQGIDTTGSRTPCGGAAVPA